MNSSGSDVSVSSLTTPSTESASFTSNTSIGDMSSMFSTNSFRNHTGTAALKSDHVPAPTHAKVNNAPSPAIATATATTPSLPIQNFVTNFIPDHETAPWLRFTILLIISIKLQLLFEHSVCFFTLAMTRYIASRKEDISRIVRLSTTNAHPWQAFQSTEKQPKSSPTPQESTRRAGHDPNMVPSSLSSPLSSSSCSYSSLSPLPQTGFMPMMRSKGQPSAVALSDDSQHSSSSQFSLDISPSSSLDRGQEQDQVIITPPTTSTTTFPSSSSPSPSSSFLPTQFEDDADDWGQFTDFEDDPALRGRNPPPSMTMMVDHDPFQSIQKTILKRRGDRLSICKLEQLQEGEEEDSDSENEGQW